MMQLKPFVSLFNAAFWLAISVFGVIILSEFGYAFDHNFEAVMGSVNDPEDGHVVATTCYTAAFVYFILSGLFACQLVVHQRLPRGEIRL
ncbi:hypothetical protein BOTBODRAFT_34137 [Botryobasidium botryosum FD-172 SS1]|uniref:MARVEL domain-containing protein n=1 Tax=Botryobasidium botryosum (strain FD-172 SS1) TaxID=930990 RepID=A0A067MAS2_BOTB1|nr:hypothetical protein BOTBODRAFT_34137 [Botryobasidium botryosum FD-172 SS1]